MKYTIIWPPATHAIVFILLSRTADPTPGNHNTQDNRRMRAWT
ncbi:conjugal transfer protein TraP, partial [Salmonella enterica subsp. enterica serovar Enteritidis]